jgi:hypothetical protein
MKQVLREEDVFFHGGKTFELSENGYSAKTRGTGVWWSDSLEVAKSYGQCIIEATLDVEHPDVIDFEGRYWYEGSVSGYELVSDENEPIKYSDLFEDSWFSNREDALEKLNEYRQLYEIKNLEYIYLPTGKTIPSAYVPVSVKAEYSSESESSKTTDQIIRESKKLGYDSVILKNIRDPGPIYKGISAAGRIASATDVVTFSLNQIHTIKQYEV